MSAITRMRIALLRLLARRPDTAKPLAGYAETPPMEIEGPQSAAQVGGRPHNVAEGRLRPPINNLASRPTVTAGRQAMAPKFARLANTLCVP
ncbi:MAG: hypothetical protein D6725_08780 [Planctomycetota bacterium]|nr:MAG: hypothetical protein D6725_08780 [Planctomycetota bacterium]